METTRRSFFSSIAAGLAGLAAIPLFGRSKPNLKSCMSYSLRDITAVDVPFIHGETVEAGALGGIRADDHMAGIREAKEHIALMGGWYGLEESQTDALCDELEALAVYRERLADGLSDYEAREDAWPQNGARTTNLEDASTS